MITTSVRANVFLIFFKANLFFRQEIFSFTTLTISKELFFYFYTFFIMESYGLIYSLNWFSSLDFKAVFKGESFIDNFMSVLLRDQRSSQKSSLTVINITQAKVAAIFSNDVNKILHALLYFNYK